MCTALNVFWGIIKSWILPFSNDICLASKTLPEPSQKLSYKSHILDSSFVLEFRGEFSHTWDVHFSVSD